MNLDKEMEKQVFSYIERYKMIETGDRVIVGVSGGADSVCLLFLLQEYRKRKDFTLEVVHVNHQIRQEEAKRTKRLWKICADVCRFLARSILIRWRKLPEKSI